MKRFARESCHPEWSVVSKPFSSGCEPDPEGSAAAALGGAAGVVAGGGVAGVCGRASLGGAPDPLALVSEERKFITGVVLPVEGGQTAWIGSGNGAARATGGSPN